MASCVLPHRMRTPPVDKGMHLLIDRGWCILGGLYRYRKGRAAAGGCFWALWGTHVPILRASSSSWSCDKEEEEECC